MGEKGEPKQAGSIKLDGYAIGERTLILGSLFDTLSIPGLIDDSKDYIDQALIQHDEAVEQHNQAIEKLDNDRETCDESYDQACEDCKASIRQVKDYIVQKGKLIGVEMLPWDIELWLAASFAKADLDQEAVQKLVAERMSQIYELDVHNGLVLIDQPEDGIILVDKPAPTKQAEAIKIGLRDFPDGNETSSTRLCVTFNDQNGEETCIIVDDTENRIFTDKKDIVCIIRSKLDDMDFAPDTLEDIDELAQEARKMIDYFMMLAADEVQALENKFSDRIIDPVINNLVENHSKRLNRIGSLKSCFPKQYKKFVDKVSQIAYLNTLTLQAGEPLKPNSGLDLAREIAAIELVEDFADPVDSNIDFVVKAMIEKGRKINEMSD